MHAQARLQHVHSGARQRGQAIFIAAIFLLLGISAAIYTVVGTPAVVIANRQNTETSRTLAQVKDALIGWSASRDPAADGANARPGELPCPDINPLDGHEDGSCVAGAIGRIPWKTLGIPEPKDEAGETLWYTLSGSFRKYNNNTAPITSDTLGNLTVYQDSTASTLTTQAVAVIFAPGAAVGSQDRSTTTTMACDAPSGNYTRNVCASNYLEATAGVDNATINGPFIQGPRSSIFNDRLLIITNADLMPLVEQRVAREIISILNAYKAATSSSLLAALLPGTGVYPWADLADGNSNGTALVAAYNRNRFPCGNALPTAWGAVPTLGTTATPTLPNWLTNGCWDTGWTSLIYYAVARNRLENSGTGCTTCTAASLSITNPNNIVGHVCTTASPAVCTTQIITAGNADLILITPGAAIASRAAGWPVAFTAISNYFEDTENRDNNDDNYVVPAATSHDRDRIYIVR